MSSLINSAFIAILQIGTAEHRFSSCIEARYTTGSFDSIDVEKCLGTKVEEVEFAVDSIKGSDPNYKKYRIKAYCTNQLVYQETITNSKLLLTILEKDLKRLRISDYELGIWGNKSGIPTNIIILKIKKDKFKTNGEKGFGQAKIPIQLVELVLSLPSLSKYFHLDLPERKPLFISDSLIEPNSNLGAGFSGFKISDSISIGRKSCLHFKSYSIEGNKATATLEFTSEGLLARLEFEYHKRWVITNQSIVEH